VTNIFIKLLKLDTVSHPRSLVC